MIKKGQFLYSILKFKCPSCHDGDFFVSHPYDLTKVGDVFSECIYCKTKFSKEPGFYFGAMYISYAFAVAFAIVLYLFFELVFFALEFEFFLLVYALLILLISPYLYALSKILWANLFIKFKK